MKRTLLTLVIAFGMVSGIFADATWLTDHKQATEIAKKDQKPILMLFTGSDWCGYCMKLDKEFFSQQDFKEFAQSDIVLLEVDFPRNKKLDATTTGASGSNFIFGSFVDCMYSLYGYISDSAR